MTHQTEHTSQVVPLPRAPEIADQIEFNDGEKVRIWRVLSADENTVNGVILASTTMCLQAPRRRRREAPCLEA